MSSEDKKEILDYISSEGSTPWDAAIEKLDFDLYQYNKGLGASESLYERGYSDGVRHAIRVLDQYRIIFKEVYENGNDSGV